MTPKERAGSAALTYIESGMNVGLGTGSTAKCFIDALGQAIRQGKLKKIRGIPTSNKSAEQAAALGIELTTFAAIDRLDVTVDGADEVSPDLTLIKGLGGALCREKIVACNSRKLVIVVDDSKRVTVMGTHSALPVEVTPFGHEATARFLASLGCKVTLRLDASQKPFVSDNTNYVYDCRFQRIDDPPQMHATIKLWPGVVDTGLFVGLAHVALLATESGVEKIERA